MTDRPMDGDAPRAEGAGPPTVWSGWAALGLAVLLGGWGTAPLVRPGGADLAALQPPAREMPGGAGAGGSAAARPRPGEAARRLKVLPAGRLDLNRATPADLAALPGIGPVLAARILEHRRAVGPFPRVEALRAVSGIGPKRYERLAPHLTVGAPDALSGGAGQPMVRP